MYKEFEENDVLKSEADQSNEHVSLPSRKRKHPKPLSFLEKPTFSLIIFILFILVLGGILFYFKYYKNADEPDQKPNVNLSSIEDRTITSNKPTGPSTNNASENLSVEADKKQDTIPVIVITEPPKAEGNSNTETTNVTAKEASKDVTHVVKEGDTLYNIAKRYFSSADATVISRIKEVNGLVDNNIRIGMKLLIPEPTKSP